jgi:hypothetical protein
MNDYWCCGQDSNLRTPAGKDFPFGRSSQSVDLESFTFDLAWLPQPNQLKMFWLLSY